MTYIQECLEKFQDLPAPLKDRIGGVTTFNLLKSLENKYQVSLSFLLVLLAIGELESEDIVDYLTAKFKITELTARSLSQEIEEKILAPIGDEIAAAFDKSAEQPLSAGQGKEIILKIFSEKLLETLSDKRAEDVRKLNILIFHTFQTDELFEDKVISLLYNSQELIGGVRINLNEGEVRPTVANWLKDFISEHGSELFSNVELVKYITTNRNIKKLSEPERDRVKKLLKLYRNLVFFPDSMENTPLEEWEIFPLDWATLGSPSGRTAEINDVLDESAQTEVAPLNGVNLSQTRRQAAGPISRSSAAPILKPQLPSLSPAAVSAPEAKINSAPLAPSEIDELQALLSQYTPTSFEYKTIKQEINRLKRQK